MSLFSPTAIVIAAIFGIAACAGPAHAASGQDPPPPDTAGKTVERDKPVEKPGASKADRGLNDLVTCKRDATKLHGPERARFMTQCIHKR